MRVRFAPSPTGHLHVGNARTALFNWLMARGSGGAFVLRIEDTDVERSTRASEAAIVEDLRWLGLEWDEGPDLGGPYGPYRQSERLGLYRARAASLIADGRAYHCFCRPEALEAERASAIAAGRPPKYSGACRAIDPAEAARRIEAGEPAVVRFRVPEERDVVFEDLVRGPVRFHTSVIGDPVLLRSDGTPAYNFAVVIDDALMRISHVVRGEDHISNTPRQVLLYEAMGVEPPAFAHLALVMGPDHAPLSKRHGATSVAEFRARGILPEALVNHLARIGWSPGGDDELLAAGELARRFAVTTVGHSAGVFDPAKLAWTNRHCIKAADPERIVHLAIDSFRGLALAGEPDAEGIGFLASVVPMAAGAVDSVVEIASRLAFLFRFDAAASLSRPEVAEVTDHPGAREVIEALAEALAEAPRLDRERFQAVAAAVRQRTGRKREELFHPIRVALTGEAQGPELVQAVPAIDRGAALSPASGIVPITGCRERASGFAAALAARGGRA